MTRHCAAPMDSPHGRDAVPARAVLIDAPLTPVRFSGASGYPAFVGDPPVADTGSEAAVRRLAFSIMISDADIQPLVADLFRVRIPTAMAHALNCYLWLGPNGVTVAVPGGRTARVIARTPAGVRNRWHLPSRNLHATTLGVACRYCQVEDGSC